jgi:hypothetical protein
MNKQNKSSISNFSIAPESIEMLEGNKKINVTLPKRTVADLQTFGCKGSLSRKIRLGVELDLALRKEIQDGGEVYVKRADGCLYRVSIPE